MPLPLVTDSLDAIPEAARGAYAEKDGKFHLDAVIEDTSGLKAKNAELIAREKKALARAAVLGDRTPEEVQADLEYAAEQRRLDAEKKGRYDDLTRQSSEKHAKEMAAKEVEKKRYADALYDNLAKREAERAIGAKGIKPTVLLPHVLPFLRVIDDGGTSFSAQVVDGKGNPRIADGQATPMTIDQLIDEFVANPDFAGIVPASGASGGGARNDGGQRGTAGVVIIPKDATPQVYRQMKADAEKRGVPYKVAAA